MTTNPSDDELLALIAESERPLPPRLVEQTKGLLSWRTVDRDIIELLSDSHDAEGALVRSTESSVRHIEFGGDGRGLRIDHLVDQHTIVGRLVDVEASEVVAEWADGSTERATVDWGRFELAARPGPVRFVVTGDDMRPITTEWVTLH